MYPGYGTGGVLGGCYTGVLPSTLPGTHIQPYLASGPYLRPNEGISEVFMRFPRIGSRKGPEKGPEMTRIDSESTLPDWSRDGPQITSRSPIPALSHTAVSNRALFKVLLTIATENRVSSKDWIRPPTQSHE